MLERRSIAELVHDVAETRNDSGLHCSVDALRGCGQSKGRCVARLQDLRECVRAISMALVSHEKYWGEGVTNRTLRDTGGRVHDGDRDAMCVWVRSVTTTQ